MKWPFWIILVFLLSVALIGCKPLKSQSVEVLSTTLEEETQKEVDTPEEIRTLIIRQVNEETRIFDVNEHHPVLYEIILDKSKKLNEDQVRPMIKDTIQMYMDDYFMQRIREILETYNEYYTASDVETIFNNTSRTALYELIELYEWTFYKNNR